MLEVIQSVLWVLIWFLSPLLILLILLQGGAGDVSSAFGGGGQLDSTLGVGANRKLARLTGWLAVGFLAAVLILSIQPRTAIDAIPAAVGDEPPAASAPSTEPVADEAPAPEPGIDPLAAFATPAATAQGEVTTFPNDLAPAATAPASGVTFDLGEDDGGE